MKSIYFVVIADANIGIGLVGTELECRVFGRALNSMKWPACKIQLRNNYLIYVLLTSIWRRLRIVILVEILTSTQPMFSQLDLCDNLHRVPEKKKKKNMYVNILEKWGHNSMVSFYWDEERTRINKRFAQCPALNNKVHQCSRYFDTYPRHSGPDFGYPSSSSWYGFGHLLLFRLFYLDILEKISTNW